MFTYELSEITAGTHFDSPAKIDDLFVITLPPCPITREQLSALQHWGFLRINVDSEIKKQAQPAENKEKTASSSAPKSSASIGKIETVDLSEFSDDEGKIPEDQIPDKFKTSEEVDISDFTSGFSEPAAEPKTPSAKKQVPDDLKNTTHAASTSLAAYVNSHSGGAAAIPSAVGGTDDISSEEDEQKKIEAAQETYEKFLDFINQVYTHYATHKEFSIPEINGKVLELCNFVRENRSFILRISPNFETRNKNFILTHSMRTTVLCIVMGLQLNMPYDKLIELGVASILHEIGQIRLPPQLYMTDKMLSPSEKAQMQTHTVIGYKILKDAGFPLSVQLGVLEHHERETGTGYPRALKGDKISLYAKIISIACSFDAITSPRTFKESKTTYEGMIELLKNENHAYDDTVVKALLFSISLYPIGAYVYLSNGKVAQVVNVSPVSPKNPIVKIIGSVNADGKPKIIQTNDVNLKIIRAMTKEETKDLKQALGETESE